MVSLIPKLLSARGMPSTFLAGEQLELAHSRGSRYGLQLRKTAPRPISQVCDPVPRMAQVGRSAAGNCPATHDANQRAKANPTKKSAAQAHQRPGR